MPCQSRHSSVFQTAIESFVAPVLHRFHVQYPNVSFNVRMSSTDEAMEGLTTGAAEIGLVLNPPVRDTIARQEVFRDRMVATFAPNHPLAKRKVVSLRELAEFPFVLTEPSFGLRQQIDRIFHQNAVRPEVFCVTSSLALVKEVASISPQCTLLPRFSVEHEVAAGTLSTTTVREFAADPLRPAFAQTVVDYCQRYRR